MECWTGDDVQIRLVGNSVIDQATGRAHVPQIPVTNRAEQVCVLNDERPPFKVLALLLQGKLTLPDVRHFLSRYFRPN
jgi:hypothetical protein